MNESSILLLHGFASSGNSSKARYLREKFDLLDWANFNAVDFNPTPIDFEYMTITGMINRLRQTILHRKLSEVSLIGSSMGALVSLHYAYRFGAVNRLLLLAPALAYGDLVTGPQLRQWREQGSIKMTHYALGNEIPLRYEFQIDGQQYTHHLSPPAPILIIHGRHDDVVPISGSRDYADRYPNLVRLIEVESDHRLSDQLEFIWTQVKSFLI
jgi:pimeloyl-ACP methyl ester carboxylesterase